MLQVEKGDIFVLAPTASTSMPAPATSPSAIKDGADDLDKAAKTIVEQAYEAGSKDNLTVQIVRIDELPESAASEVFGQPRELPLPPLLEARMVFDGYRIVRELHGSAAAAISISPSISRPTPSSPSRFPRSTCATTPPI